MALMRDMLRKPTTLAVTHRRLFSACTRTRRRSPPDQPRSAPTSWRVPVSWMWQQRRRRMQSERRHARMPESQSVRSQLVFSDQLAEAFALSTSGNFYDQPCGWRVLLPSDVTLRTNNLQHGDASRI